VFPVCLKSLILLGLRASGDDDDDADNGIKDSTTV